MIWMTNPTWKSTQHKVIIYIYIYIYYHIVYWRVSSLPASQGERIEEVIII